MKKLSFLLAALAVVCFLPSCSKQKEHLVGVIPEWGDDTLFVKYTTLTGEDGYDVIYARKGRFTYTLETDTPVLFTVFNPDDFVAVGQGFPIIPESRSVKVFLTPESRLRVTGNATPEAVEYRVRGSQLAEDMSRMRSEMLQLQKETDMREVEILRSAVGLDAEGQYNLYVERQELIRKIQDAELEFALRNPDREVAAFILSTQPLDTLRKYESHLDARIRYEGMFKNIFDRRQNQEPISIEVPAQ